MEWHCCACHRPSFSCGGAAPTPKPSQEAPQAKPTNTPRWWPAVHPSIHQSRLMAPAGRGALCFGFTQAAAARASFLAAAAAAAAAPMTTPLPSIRCRVPNRFCLTDRDHARLACLHARHHQPPLPPPLVGHLKQRPACRSAEPPPFFALPSLVAGRLSSFFGCPPVDAPPPPTTHQSTAKRPKNPKQSNGGNRGAHRPKDPRRQEQDKRGRQQLAGGQEREGLSPSIRHSLAQPSLRRLKQAAPRRVHQAPSNNNDRRRPCLRNGSARPRRT